MQATRKQPRPVLAAAIGVLCIISCSGPGKTSSGATAQPEELAPVSTTARTPCDVAPLIAILDQMEIRTGDSQRVAAPAADEFTARFVALDRTQRDALESWAHPNGWVLSAWSITKAAPIALVCELRDLRHQQVFAEWRPSMTHAPAFVVALHVIAPVCYSVLEKQDKGWAVVSSGTPPYAEQLERLGEDAALDGYSPHSMNTADRSVAWQAGRGACTLETWSWNGQDSADVAWAADRWTNPNIHRGSSIARGIDAPPLPVGPLSEWPRPVWSLSMTGTLPK
jgi:hypothetical protein